MHSLLRTWDQLPEGMRLVVALLIAAALMLRAAKAEGALTIVFLVGAFVAVAYAVVAALAFIG